MHKVSIKILFLILFFGLSKTNGQEPAGMSEKQLSTARATAQIQLLKEGALIVRLQSMRRQRDHYAGQISQSNDGEIKRINTKKLNDLLADRDSFNRALMYGISQEYRFSQYRFIYDEDYSKSDTGHNNRHFLGDDLKADPTLSIGSTPFLVLSKLHYTTESGVSREVLRITTPDLNIVESPFPQLQNDRGLSLAIDYPGILNKSHRKAASKIVRRLNKKLVNFYVR